ncbi:MAG TPA: glycosyltransferase family 39 protein [Syntrophobacteraceae bacterium]|nr:glycosyltransferase family 39 protein [Syntrophobacteraceae bacterium]
MSLKDKQIPVIYFLLAAVTFTAFLQLSQCEFITYDDPAYVTENIHIRHVITMDAIRWAFTSDYACNWHPLTWVSHMLDIQLFGLNPHWHHLTNLLFHIANTLLLFYVFHRMTQAPWKSAFVAALFAIHPLHVQSVAWVAERKDVLSTFFWMLTMGAYVHYVERRSVARYATVVVFFISGLMSKPMLVTLPFVLLLLDYWPLRQRPEVASQVTDGGGQRSEVGGRMPNAGRLCAVRMPRSFSLRFRQKEKENPVRNSPGGATILPPRSILTPQS